MCACQLTQKLSEKYEAKKIFKIVNNKKVNSSVQLLFEIQRKYHEMPTHEFDANFDM